MANDEKPPEVELAARGSAAGFVLTCMIALLDEERPGFRDRLRDVTLANFERVADAAGTGGAARSELERSLRAIIK